MKRIEQLANLKFAKAVRDAGVFRVDEIEEMVDKVRYVDISSADDVVLITPRK